MIINKISSFLKIITVFVFVALLSGCAAIGTAVAHRNLQTQTFMSNSVFLNPVPESDRTIFIQVRNTSNQYGFDIGSRLTNNLINRGYRVVYNPAAAHYVLQVQILNVGKFSKTAARNVFGSPYGGAIEGAAAGAAIGAAAGSNILAGGVIGAVGGSVVDNLVENVTYRAVVDIRITEKPRYRVYATRIVATANQVNLTFGEAKPRLEVELAHAIAGLF